MSSSPHPRDDSPPCTLLADHQNEQQQPSISISHLIYQCSSSFHPTRWLLLWHLSANASSAVLLVHCTTMHVHCDAKGAIAASVALCNQQRTCRSSTKHTMLQRPPPPLPHPPTYCPSFSSCIVHLPPTHPLCCTSPLSSFWSLFTLVSPYPPSLLPLGPVPVAVQVP